eukprot:TRINITY_DN6454_c0_g1_i2.p1 TRINITY_DN6454_c0_g1~~TRINITY_DN6454_c0_g1_i2.p1  ORF type:complete len:124 (-),score=25.26 TRINITY_DN6454_c0_g1_i2:156-527(-)
MSLKTGCKKNELLHTLHLENSKVEDIISETEVLEKTRVELENQVIEKQKRIKAEIHAIEELKQSKMKTLAENEVMKEQTRMLNSQLEKYAELKKKRDSMFKDVLNHKGNVQKMNIMSYLKILI